MIGKILAHYEISSQLGKGGMGEVYRAKDQKLGRDVAIKVLPEEFARDPERVARFEREAKLLASLNHPNIAAIHGLEETNGTHFLVMELVEGDTLADQLKSGPIPVEEALSLALQIAEALEAAHEKGIIHRDLKPANVMLTEGDKVKILDFGLAKALSEETQSVDSSRSPTLTEAMTRPGIILGTTAYMSPEQAKGKAADRRADIWAFGCILYECLTGKKAFEGETVTETLAAVLKNEPVWQALPAATPPGVRFVLQRCLEKEMRRRFQNAGDVRIMIEEPQSAVETTVPKKRPWLAWIAAALLLACIALLITYLREKKAPSAADPMRLQIVPSAGLAPEGSFALSPDGRSLAFAAKDSDGMERIWIRALDSLEARPLSGTESDYLPPFFWSPDSRFIAFNAGGKLKKIDVFGGPPQALCDLAGYSVGGSWNRDGVIIFGYPDGGLRRISADGGIISTVTRPNKALKETIQLFPVFLPDGKHFFYYSGAAEPERTGVYIGSLEDKSQAQAPRQLLTTTFAAVYVPSQNSGLGRLLFMREQTLMAQYFNEARLELVGDAIPVAEQVGSFMAFGFFSASANNMLVYRRGGSGNRVQWFDRQGYRLGKAGEPGEYWGLSLSPDNSKAAVSLLNPAQVPSIVDTWILDLVRVNKTRFTLGESSNNYSPVWSPDGSRIIFTSNRKGGAENLYLKSSSGAKDSELLFKSDENKIAGSWSSDGRLLLYTEQNATTQADLWVLPLQGERKPLPILQNKYNETDGQFSPDMHWIAYTSDETGRNEVYVRRFSLSTEGSSLEAGDKWILSRGGGMAPRWKRDGGKELYYRASDGKVMAVAVKTAGTLLEVGSPRPLFQAPAAAPKIQTMYTVFFWDVSADGERFFMPAPDDEGSPAPFSVILNWTELLKK